MLGDGHRARLAWALEALRSRSDNGAAELGRAFRAAVSAWDGRPTFWFVNVCECHAPCMPPRPWNDLSSADRVRAGLEARRHYSFEALCLYAAGRRDLTGDALERMRHLYGRAAAYADRWIADALEALDARGILDDTLVIVTADHGENFGEHGLLGHGFALNETLVNVPLVMAGPGAPAPDGAFSLASLPRLLATVAGLDAHPYDEDELTLGVAVSQYDALGPPDHPRVRDFAERWELDEAAVGRLTASFTSVTDGRRKLVQRDDDEPLLYDLEHDPGEREPLGPAPADSRFAELADILEHPAVAADRRGIPTVTAAQVPASAELAALERQMKLLGYL